MVVLRPIPIQSPQTPFRDVNQSAWFTIDQSTHSFKPNQHVHLDGSPRISTIIELAQEHGVKLPAYTEAGLRETVFKDNYESLNEYLTGFPLILQVMQQKVGLWGRLNRIESTEFNNQLLESTLKSNHTTIRTIHRTGRGRANRLRVRDGLH